MTDSRVARICGEEIDKMRGLLVLMETGVRTTQEIRLAGPCDTTQETIAFFRRAIAILEPLTRDPDA